MAGKEKAGIELLKYCLNWTFCFVCKQHLHLQILQRFESYRLSLTSALWVKEQAFGRGRKQLPSLDTPENSGRKAGRDVTSTLSYPFLLQKLDAGNQLALIEDLHRDIRAVGNEAKGEHVPGFCIPKKVKDQNEHVMQRWHRHSHHVPPFGGFDWYEISIRNLY